MTNNNGSPHHLLVANLSQISLESLVKSKLEVLLQQSKEGGKIKNLYSQVIEQVEKPMIELALSVHEGNQIKTAAFLGINRNTLRKKITTYKISLRNFA